VRTLDEIKRLYVGTVTNTESTIFDLTNGAVLKTIVLYNDNATKETVSLNIDGTVFNFDVDTKTTVIIDKAIVCNILKAKTNTNSINIHISGIQLGGA
jgi:Cu2+-containing amine oxidase